jgi:hypothetical protein
VKVDLDYEGPLFGRVKGRYCDLVLTSKDVDKLESDRSDLLEALEVFISLDLRNDADTHQWPELIAAVANAEKVVKKAKGETL